MSCFKWLLTTLQNLGKFLIDLPYYIGLLIYTFIYSGVESVFRKRKNLNGETILVTGAASGLGQQAAWRLAKSFPNAVYVLWDINENGLTETAKKCEELGACRVYQYKVDLSQRTDVVKAADLVRNEVGSVTVLWNNAGLANYQSFFDTDPVTEEMVIRVNLLSYMWTIREFLPGMIQQRKGHVVCTCSGLSFYRLSHHTAYIASKYGLRGFMDSLKLEMRMQHGDKPEIKFTTIYPGFIRTPMTSLMSWEPRYQCQMLTYMDADIFIEETVDGILKEKEEVTVPGSTKIIQFYRLLPNRFVDAVEGHLCRNMTFSSKRSSRVLDIENRNIYLQDTTSQRQCPLEPASSLLS